MGIAAGIGYMRETVRLCRANASAAALGRDGSSSGFYLATRQIDSLARVSLERPRVCGGKNHGCHRAEAQQSGPLQVARLRTGPSSVYHVSCAVPPRT